MERPRLVLGHCSSLGTVLRVFSNVAVLAFVEQISCWSVRVRVIQRLERRNGFPASSGMAIQDIWQPWPWRRTDIRRCLRPKREVS